MPKLPPKLFHKSTGLPSGPKIIGVVGSRTRVGHLNYDLFEDAFDKVYREGDTLVSGGCPTGGDYFAESLARKRGLTITIHMPFPTSGRALQAFGWLKRVSMRQNLKVR